METNNMKVNVALTFDPQTVILSQILLFSTLTPICFSQILNI